MEQLNYYENHLIIYTDGSKSISGVGSAIVIDNKDYKLFLLLYCSIFTAELFASYVPIH